MSVDHEWIYRTMAAMTAGTDASGDEELSAKIRGVMDLVWHHRMTQAERDSVNSEKDDEAWEKERSEAARIEILASISSGNVAIAASDATLKGLGEQLAGRRETDYTVTEADLTATGRDCFVISWGTVSAGFGELTFYRKEGRTQVDTECMGRDFCLDVLTKLFDRANGDPTWSRKPAFCRGRGGANLPQSLSSTILCFGCS